MLNFIKQGLIISLIFSMTNSFTKALDRVELKTQNSNTYNYFFGLKLDSNNSDKTILIEFETDNKQSFFIIVGENQKFYNFKTFDKFKSIFLKKFQDCNLEILQQKLQSVWIEAKDLKTEDKIKGNCNTNLTVKNIYDVKLNKAINSYNLFEKNNYTFFPINLTSFTKNTSLIKNIFSIDNLIIICTGALAYGLFGGVVAGGSATYQNHSDISFSKGFKLGSKVGAFLLEGFFLISLLSDKYLNTIHASLFTQTGNFTISKADSLSKKIKQLNDYNTNFIKIDFIDKNKLTNEQKINLTSHSPLSIYEEILIDNNNNIIKDKNGKIAHLVIAKYKEYKN